MSRTEYEFIGESGQRIRATAASATGLEVWGDLLPDWEDADVAIDPEAFVDAASELLKLARIIDAYDDLARVFIDKVESYETRSTHTYERFKQLLAREGL